jgi:hypothetical protein
MINLKDYIEESIMDSEENLSADVDWLDIIGSLDVKQGFTDNGQASIQIADYLYSNSVVSKKYKLVKNYGPMLKSSNQGKWWVAVYPATKDPRMLIFRQYTDEEYKNDIHHAPGATFSMITVNNIHVGFRRGDGEHFLKSFTKNGRSYMFEIPKDMHDDCEKLMEKVRHAVRVAYGQ